MSDFQKLQADLFGERYRGACLSRVSLPAHCSSLVNQWTTKPNNFLVVTGPPGTGKTYLCAALTPHLKKNNNTFRVWNERDILQRLRSGIAASSGDYLYHLQQYIDDDFVVMDDIGSSGHNAWREEILMEMVDYRYRLNKPTIFTSNLDKYDFFKQYNPRVGSRLFATQNVIVDMTGMPDHRERGN